MIEFDWDKEKNIANHAKHGIRFEEACLAFDDPDRIIAHDELHSAEEQRWFCIGNVEGRIVTVRFTVRENVIRIIGAGQWRKWRKYYEQKRQRR